MSYTLLILGMAALTFAVKALFFIIGDRLVFPGWLRDALGFVPVAVLTAIIVPMVIAPAGALALSTGNPRLIGALVALAVCVATRRQLPTIVAGMGAFLIWQLA